MSLLFVTTDNVNPLCGGIDRMTYLLASEFNKRGYKCVSAYLQKKNPDRPADGIFTAEILLENGNHCAQLIDIFEAHKIDIIIAQGVNLRMNQEMICLREAVDNQSRRIQLLFVFHQMPGHELNRMDWSVLLGKMMGKSRKQYLKQFCIQMLLPFSKRLLQKNLYAKYCVPYQNADRIILLSSAYTDDFNALAGGSDKRKYAAIPNMLTFPYSDMMPTGKERMVLMVSRMDEQAKRIKSALQIWRRLPQDLLDKGWKLVIVGDGEDLAYYRKYVVSNKIENVSFEGQQDPLPYYRQSSVFMMTSAFEGWPMTLMEAMQNGCVPIAFDSFKAVYDIIEDGVSGVIIPEGRSEDYVARLAQLMREDGQREKMARAGLVSCRRFSQEHITQQWLDLFDKLVSK